jgi:hypothetical protein
MDAATFAPEFAPICEGLNRIGRFAEECVQLIQSVTESPETHQPVQVLRAKLSTAGIVCSGDALERVLLSLAADVSRPRVNDLPVAPSVKKLLLREWDSYAAPPQPGTTPLAAGSYAFVIGAKTASLRRFPAGPLDWEISGMPRSWCLQIPWRDRFRAFRLIALEMRGFAPVFFTHVAPRPRNRALILRSAVLKCYHSIARSLMLQPEIRGIVTESWFHDPQALKENPHLAALNEPYLYCGGWLTTLGTPSSASAPLLQNGENGYAQDRSKYQRGLAIWPRQAVISWALQHPELEN